MCSGNEDLKLSEFSTVTRQHLYFTLQLFHAYVEIHPDKCENSNQNYAALSLQKLFLRMQLCIHQ